MTSGKTARKRRTAAAGGEHRSTSLPWVATAVAAVVVLGVAVFALAGTDPPTTGAAGTPTAPPTTGELNEMGMPVLATPGSASGTVAAAGIEVVGAEWSLGRVPLDVAVRPDWTLTNTGDAPVRLGEPQAEVRAGCCPGALSLSQDVLAPGERATLTFELSMHEGMDGWHDMLVHVPLAGARGDDVLTLAVTGDFRS